MEIFKIVEGHGIVHAAALGLYSTGANPSASVETSPREWSSGNVSSPLTRAPNSLGNFDYYDYHCEKCRDGWHCHGGRLWCKCDCIARATIRPEQH